MWDLVDSIPRISTNNGLGSLENGVCKPSFNWGSQGFSQTNNERKTALQYVRFRAANLLLHAT